MTKHSTSWRIVYAFKQLAITTFIGLFLWFFMSVVTAQVPWLDPLMQMLLLFMFTFGIYVPFWEFGDRDLAAVLFEQKQPCYFYGFKIAFVCVIPHMVASLFLLLAKLGLPNWMTVVYRLVNIEFVYIFDWLVPNGDVTNISWLITLVCAILPLYLVLIGGVAYILGIKGISLKDKVLYSNKKS